MLIYTILPFLLKVREIHLLKNLSFLTHRIPSENLLSAGFFVLLMWMQGRNEVRWRPGQEASLVPPCLNLSSFESKCIVMKKVLLTLLERFEAPRSHSAPPQWFGAGELYPAWPPSIRLCVYETKSCLSLLHVVIPRRITKISVKFAMNSLTFLVGISIMRRFTVYSLFALKHHFPNEQGHWYISLFGWQTNVVDVCFHACDLREKKWT